MKTKTGSVRLPKEMFEEIDQVCDGIGCSRNDWIKDALRDKLREESNDEKEVKEEKKEHKTWEVSLDDNSPKEEPKPTVEIIPNPTVEIIPTPTAKVIPQDNSNKPVIEMVEFNGKYIPKVEVNDIWLELSLVLIAVNK